MASKAADFLSKLLGLDDPSVDEVARAASEYSAKVVGSVAAYQSLQGGNGGSQPWQVTDWIDLDDNNIKALGVGTQVELVPTPGMGKFLNFGYAVITVDAGAHPYTVDNGAYIQIETSTGVSTALLGGASGVLVYLLGGDGEEAIAWFIPNSATYLDRSQAEDKALSLGGFNNGAGPFADGNAANTGRIKVWYTVEDLP